MFIDFDHGVVEVERPIRLQGIYKRDVEVGSNVWIGYGACILRGVRVGDNAIVGTNAVVTKDVPANAVVAGVPARVIRMREAPARAALAAPGRARPRRRTPPSPSPTGSSDRPRPGRPQRMPDSEEKLDEKKAIDALNAALRAPVPLRPAVLADRGQPARDRGAGDRLAADRFGDEELADARRLIEKIVSFGGEPTTEVAELRYDRGAEDAISLAGRVRGGGGRAAAGSDRADRPRGPLGGARAPARAPDPAQAAAGRLPAAGESPA